MTPSPSYPEGIYNRLFKGLSANVIGQALNLAQRVLLVPLFLKAWGADVYGEWLLLSSFVAYLSLTDMGGQLYIINRLTQAYAQRNILLFRKVLHTGLALFLIMPSVVFLLFVAVILLISPESLLEIRYIDQQQVVWVLAILAFQFVFALPQGILLGTYRAVGLLPLGVMLANLVMLLQIALVAIGLWLDGGVIWIAVLYTLPLVIVAMIALKDLNRRFPYFDLLSLKEAEYTTGRKFVKPSLHFLSIQLAQTFSIQGMVLVVGLLLAPVQVVLFSTLRTIANTMRQLLSLIAHTAWPELTRLDAEQDIDKLYVLFRAVLRTTLAAATVLAIIFHLFGGEIYRLWVGDAVVYQQVLMDLFLIYVLQLVFWTVCSHLLMATNRHYTLSRILLISSALSIVMAYASGQYFGLQGVVLAIIVSDLLLPFWFVPYLTSRYQERFSLRFFLKEVIPIVGSLAIVFFFTWLVSLVLFLLLIWWVSSIFSISVVG